MSRLFVLSVSTLACVTLVVAGVVGTSHAQSAVSRAVVVSDAGVLPKIVSITVGSSVLWVNGGTASHHIVAAHNAFPTFDLAPRATKRLAFGTMGRYPYTVDARLDATIVVVAAGPVGTGAAAGTAAALSHSQDCRPAMYRYDIRVELQRDYTEVRPQLSGSKSVTSDAKGSWVAPIAVRRCRGQLTIGIADGQQKTVEQIRGGQMTLSAQYIDSIQPFRDQEIPSCQYSVSNTYDGRLGMSAYGDDALKHATFVLNATADTAAVGTDVANTATAACGALRSSGGLRRTFTGLAHNQVIVVKGPLQLAIGPFSLVMRFQLPPEPPGAAGLVTSLGGGKDFTYDSGQQLINDTGNGESARVRAIVSFALASAPNPR